MPFLPPNQQRQSLQCFDYGIYESLVYLFTYLFIYAGASIFLQTWSVHPSLVLTFLLPPFSCHPHHLPKNPTTVSGQYCQPLINFLKKKTIWGWEVWLVMIFVSVTNNLA